MISSENSAFTPARRKAERLAIASSCCGFTGEAVLTESAVGMLFAGMLGAGETIKLMTTAVFPFLSGVLMIPMAVLAMRRGGRKMAVAATLAATAAYLLVTLTPWCGRFRVEILMGLMVIFSISLSSFVAGWFPVLDTFLLPERRTGFIGRMRFCHQGSAVIFLLFTGMVMGREPDILRLAVLIGIAGVIFAGRALFIALLPPFPEERPLGSDWREGLRIACGNRRLLKSALYLGALNLFSCGTTPLWLLFLQKSGCPENVLVYISSAALGGMMLGYFFSGKLLKQECAAKNLKYLHLALLLLGTVLLLLPLHGFWQFILSGVLLTMYNFCIAMVAVAATSMMMAVTTPGNKVMAMALFGAVGNTCMGLSRVAAALLVAGAAAGTVVAGMSLFRTALCGGLILLTVLLFFRKAALRV